jgi:DNA-binding CsgD family transcriptional regulator
MSLSEPQQLVGIFAEMIVEVRDPSVAWPLMLERLQQTIGFDAGYIAASWGNATEGRGAIANHDEPFLRRNLGRFLAEIHPEEVALYADRARVHHDVWTPQRQQELSVFRELLIPTGMKHMIVRVSVRHGNVAGFNLERRNAAYPFSDRDLHLVDLVAPFLHIVEVLTLQAQDDTVFADFVAEHRLTAREAEFVALTARGLQNAEIALLTGVSANTVRNTLVRVFEKVGVGSRAELAYFASRPSGIHGVRSVIAPPASRRLDDGLQAFTARVEDASVSKNGASSFDRPAYDPARIVYTAPLTNIG